MNLVKHALVPAGHSRPVGRYSPGIALSAPATARLVFITGQVATDDRGNVLAAGDAAGQAGIVFDRLRQVLGAAGGDLADLVSLTIYLRDVARDFKTVSAVRDRVLSDPAPASTLVEVSRLVEDGCLVEISGIAAVGLRDRDQP